MVGKQERVGMRGAVSDHGVETSSALAVGSVLLMCDVERDAGHVGEGKIASHSMRSDPPKHKDNNPPQAFGIGREKVEGAAQRSSVSARSNESASRSARQSTSGCAGVAVGAHYAARRLRGHGRDAERETGRNAARDVRAAGRQGDAERWLAQLAPARLPPGVERTVNDSHSKWYRVRLAITPLMVILEIEVWQGELWAHLAITGRTSPPTLAELCSCRELFLGDRKAIQVLPRKIEQVEAGARTVHLYAPLESDALPSFSTMGEHR